MWKLDNAATDQEASIFEGLMRHKRTSWSHCCDGTASVGQAQAHCTC